MGGVLSLIDSISNNKETMLLKEEKIFNYLNGFSDPSESAEVEAWKAESEANASAFEQIKKIHELSAVNTTAAQPNVEVAWDKVSDHLFSAKEVKMPDTTSTSGNMALLYRIAAVLVLAVGVSYFFLAQQNAGQYDLAYTTAQGEVKELTLADGTQVVVNENSTFRYQTAFEGDHRSVYLEGEAFFDVAKNPDKPFVIHSETATTKVLGTSFNLIASKKGAAVDVFSGKVAFGNLEKNASNVVLVKGQRAVYHKGKAQLKEGANPNALAWKTRQLTFEATPLKDMVRTLEKIYRVDIEYPKEIANCSITSTFDNQTLEQVLDLVQIVANIDYSEKNGIYTLSGTGCK